MNKNEALAYLCPQCGKRTVRPSGFMGNPFCWGECYHYFAWEEVQEPDKPTTAQGEVKDDP